MCLVLGRIFGLLTLVANSTAPQLSSKTLHLMTGLTLFSITPFSSNFSINSIRGSTSLVALEIAMYSLSVVDSATSL